MVRIKARFAERVLAPGNALAGVREGDTVETSDGVSCVAHFLSGWDNADGRYDDELDGLCERQWGISFPVLRSVWIGRINYIGNIWHMLQLKKI